MYRLHEKGNWNNSFLMYTAKNGNDQPVAVISSSPSESSGKTIFFWKKKKKPTEWIYSEFVLQK